ncbi:MAG: hypothetical protein IKP07_06200 [Bacilli bacterium]|nr:hypothetical protein [Bacilli bacterium]
MLEKIAELMSRKDFTQADVYQLFTPEERRIIATESIYESAVFLQKCYKKGIKILSPEEAWKEIKNLNPEDYEVLVSILAEYLTQEQLYRYILEKGFSNIAYKLKETKLMTDLIDRGAVPQDNLACFISDIPDDDTKVYYMKKNLKRDEYYEVLFRIESDEKKLEYLRFSPFGDKIDFIASLKEDENKKQFISTFSRGKGTIISSLESDELKEYYFNKYFNTLSGYDKGKIVASFDDITYVQKYYPLLKSGSAITEYFIYTYSGRRDDIDIKKKLIEVLTKEKDIVFVLDYVRNRKLRLLLLKKIRSPKAIKEVISNSRSQDTDIEYIIDKVDEKTRESLLRKIRSPYILFRILNKISNKNTILNIIAHQDDYPTYSDEYEYLVDIYVERYNLNKEHTIRLLKVVGCSLFNQIGTKNIIAAINLDEESFTNYLKIISEQNMTVTESSQNDVLNSFIQREFRIKEKATYEIFPTIVHAIEDKDYQRVSQLLEAISKYVNLEEYGTTFEKLFNSLMFKPTDELMDTLRKITTKYLVLKRNEFLKKEIIDGKEKSCRKKYEKNTFANYFMKNVDPKFFAVSLEDEDQSIFTEEEKELIDKPDIIIRLIEFKRKPKETSELTLEEKKMLPILVNIIDKLENKRVNKYLDLPIKYEIIPTKMSEVVNIMASINPTQLQETVFNNPKAFAELLDFLKKYRVLGWSGKYEKVALEADIDFTATSIAELINNFPAIIEGIERDAVKNNTDPQKTLTRIMDRASLFDTLSRRYSILFGKDNTFYLKANPGPNSSGLPRNKRIAIALEYIKKMYKRKSIPVPGVDKDFTLSNNKKINIVVGNTTDMINLTYGERTGACMRIGGAGASLFDYCLNGKNGFHIRFSDPETNEFVSRVSCFRNGNTIFMNQLRNSVSIKYKDEDLIEAAKMIGKELIELTKDSDSPIKNVVINQSYAMYSSKKHSTNLGVKDVKKGLGSFYSDVDEVAIVLATANKDDSLIPIDLDAKVPEYQPQRGRINYYEGEKAQEMVEHYHMLNNLLNDHSIESGEIVLNENIVACISGDDWYISVDNKGKIEQFILSTTIRKNDALKEMQASLEVLKERIAAMDKHEERKLA